MDAQAADPRASGGNGEGDGVTIRAQLRMGKCGAFWFLGVLVLAVTVPARAEELNRSCDLSSRKSGSSALRRNPLFATTAGDHRYDARLPSMTREDLSRRAAFREALLAPLEGDRPARACLPRIGSATTCFPGSSPTPSRRTSTATWRIPLNADSGFSHGLRRPPRPGTASDVRDYENYIARPRRLSGVGRTGIALMRAGLKSGFTLPRVGARRPRRPR